MFRTSLASEPGDLRAQQMHSETSTHNESSFASTQQMVQFFHAPKALSIIEEDENDLSCFSAAGQLKKQTAVQCLSSLACGAPPDDAMETDGVFEASLQQNGYTINNDTEEDEQAPSVLEEDDWGYFYADSTSIDHHNSAALQAKRRPPLSKRRRSTFKYPRGRCSASGAVVLPPKLCFN
mmetsp:Transcript_15581/g.20298  ORF Transcript_15581/g.20298 Transcript_15581/m.20298 type:complete len:180 (-) Transcript_15581:135-674(-)|eukprot:CAMPEP_0198148866 /NCGR_PEP_ID=MMETSP1443-20131203/43783_1 /TAXON_ID=186043 /ORGANISM="Entomoneis sp., Strain CCMP2396" /LENGTH=179 /DNA_ID=CAMNT_0043813715 /DNA_START=223 /DNA_END=762 /DNA_ORIENTATION=+